MCCIILYVIIKNCLFYYFLYYISIIFLMLTEYLFFCLFRNLFFSMIHSSKNCFVNHEFFIYFFSYNTSFNGKLKFNYIILNYKKFNIQIQYIKYFVNCVANLM